MDNYTLTIKVDDGNFFEGNLEQWEDCIFSFPSDFSVNEKISQIQDYCVSFDYDLTLSFKNTGNQKENFKVKVAFQ